MAVKTQINTKGIEQISGNGFTVVKNTGNSGFYPYGQASVTNITANTTFSAGQAGILVLSGDVILTGTLPRTEGNYGMMLTIRCGSNHAHALSSSLDAQDNLNITNGTAHGNKLTFDNVSGSSVCLLNDGVNWLVLGNSGSLTITTSTT